MKPKSLLLFLIGLFSFLQAKAADGDTFAANTSEGVSMTFKIISEDDKTVQVGNNSTSIALTTVGTMTIPNSVTHSDITYSVVSIGYRAFSFCNRITSVVIPNSIKSIGKEAFYSGSALTSIAIPDGVTTIANATFFYCEGLTTVTLPNSVTTIEESAFFNCTSLATINLPTNLQSIGAQAFSYCSSWVTDVELPNGIKTIGDQAFAFTSFTSISIPSSVTNFVSTALHGNTQLKKFIVPSLEKWFTIDLSSNGQPMASSGRNGYLRYAKLYVASDTENPIEDLVIPNSLTSIGIDAFYEACTLKSVKIPNSVTSIARYAFKNAKFLTSIEIPGSISTIDDYTFEGCTGLQSLKLNEGLLQIGTSAFKDCSNLKAVTFPASLTEIGGAAFKGCTSIQSINISDNITTIGYHADGGTFQGCTSLTSVIIGSGITKIAAYMFSGCTGLESIEIPNNRKEIDFSAFYGCTNLTKVVFPNSITTVMTGSGYSTRPGAFDGCTNLTQVVVPDFNIADWCGKYLVGGPLCYSHHLYDTEGNDLIVDAVIPEGVNQVREYAFQGCESMTSLILPSTTTSIGSYSFGYCSYLTSVTCKMKTPCTINNTTFYQLPTCTLYIPYGTKDAYIAAGWTESIFKGGIVEVDGRLEQSLSQTSLPSMTYGDGDYALPAKTAEGLTLTWTSGNASVATISGNTLTVKGAGTASIVAQQEGNEDHKPFSESFTLTVAKAPLTITANNVSKNVGDTNPTFTASYSGFVQGENATVLTKQPKFTTEADEDSPIGTYDIEVSGAEATNYEISYTKGILTVVDERTLNNTLAIQDKEMLIGRTGVLPVELNNTEDITAIQFDLTLPAGVSIAKNSKGKYLVEKTSRDTDHTLSASKQGDANVYTILLYSNDVELIEGNAGIAINVTLEASESMIEGGYTITISNINLTMPDETKIIPANVACTLTVKNSIPGDSNGDGSIDVTDIVGIANAILGNPSASMNAAAADVNGDGCIDVTDIVAVANIILHGGNQNNAKRRVNDGVLDPQ